MTDRCPICDRPECDRATVPAVGGPVPACAALAVDWRARAIAAERLLSDERAAHAETSRDLDALLTALGAQVTPGGQTEDACQARRVADGMRRAAGSAPAKCSCTSEAGDSRCLAHPTCSECGVFTPSCVDSCDDHAKAIADAEERGRTDGTLAPHDVEVAISDLVAASRDLEVYAAGKVTAKRTKSAEVEFGRARTAIRVAIAAEIERARAEGRAESPAAPATVARPISEWHEGMVGWLLATEPNGAIIEYERDEPGKFAQIKIAPGKFWRRRAWADGKWWAWCDVSVIDADVIKRPARLVPASEADADPASRGPIGGGS